MSAVSPSGDEFWVIKHKGRAVAVIRAQGERHAKQQAIAWVRGRLRQGVLWRNIEVRPQVRKAASSRITKSRMSWQATGDGGKSTNAGQSLALVGLLVLMAWLWRDLI